MKKILCITESLAGGGAEHQMAILCDLLYQNDYSVTLLTYADIPDHYSINSGITRVRLAEGKPKIPKIMALFAYILRTDVDCIISYRSLCNMRVMVPAFINRKPKYIVGERNTNVSGTPNKYEKWNVDRGLYKAADFIVANSHTQADYLRRRKPSWSGKIRTIINYTDLRQFHSAAMPNEDIIKVAVFARLSAQKNPVGFADMLKVLKQKTNQPFHVDWYCGCKNIDGSYTEEYISLRRRIEEYGVEDVFSIKEAVKNPAEFMEQYHAICLPSLFEGFSNSVAEGICSAKPMLVSNVSDNSMMVHDGVNGFLFDPKDINSMTEAFLKFFNTTFEQKLEMGKQSRLIAEDLFDETRFINDYIKLIEQ